MAPKAKMYAKQIFAGNVLKLATIQGYTNEDLTILHADGTSYVTVRADNRVNIKSQFDNVKIESPTLVEIDSPDVKLTQQQSLSPVTTDVDGIVG